MKLVFKYFICNEKNIMVLMDYFKFLTKENIDMFYTFEIFISDVLRQLNFSNEILINIQINYFTLL